MTSIRLDQIKPGMITGADIRDKSGRLLLKAQTPITENRLNILKTWGIQQIQIASAEEQPLKGGATPAPISTATLRRATEQIEQRFQQANTDHEVVHTLRDFCIDYHARQLERKGRGG